MIRLKCPKCEKKLGIDDSKAGAVAICPACRQKFRVPVPKVSTAAATAFSAPVSRQTPKAASALADNCPFDLVSDEPSPAPAQKPRWQVAQPKRNGVPKSPVPTKAKQPVPPKAEDPGYTVEPKDEDPGFTVEPENEDSGYTVQPADKPAPEPLKNNKPTVLNDEDDDEDGVPSKSRLRLRKKKKRDRGQGDQWIPGINNYVTAAGIWAIAWFVMFLAVFLIPVMSLPVYGISAVLYFFSVAGFLVAVYQEDGGLHAVLCFLFWPYALYYAVTRWQATGKAFLCMMAANSFLLAPFLGLVLHAVRLVDRHADRALAAAKAHGPGTMTLDQAIRRLRERNQPVPQPLRLPTPAEVDQAERRLAVRFHPDFRRYLLECSDITFGTLEPVTITSPDAETDLFKVAQSAWKDYSIPRDLLPICEDNADFYCMNSAGEIVFWSTNGLAAEKWPNLAAWIEQVWLHQD